MKPKNKKHAAPEPALNCTHSAIVDPKALEPNPDNPNKHPAEQRRLYAKILLHQGWRKALVVSKQSKRLVTGHGAWETAIEQGWSQVPVDYQDFAAPADEYAHMLADNRLPQLAQMDEAEFAAILAREVEGSLDLELAAVLDEESGPVELKPVEVRPPPKMAWVLIGIPLVRFSEVNQHIEGLAKVPDVVLESTVNDQVPDGQL